MPSEGKGCKLRTYPYSRWGVGLSSPPKKKNRTKIKTLLITCLTPFGGYEFLQHRKRSPCAGHHAEDSTSTLSCRGMLKAHFTNGENEFNAEQGLAKVI